MVGIAPGHRMVFQLPEFTGERDVLGLGTGRAGKVRQQRFLDRAEQIVVGDRLGEIDPDEFRTDVRGELLDPHQITKIDEPVVFPASRSRCAWTASSSS